MRIINEYYAFEETKGKIIGEVCADTLEKAKKFAAIQYLEMKTLFKPAFHVDIMHMIGVR